MPVTSENSTLSDVLVECPQQPSLAAKRHRFASGLRTKNRVVGFGRHLTETHQVFGPQRPPTATSYEGCNYETASDYPKYAANNPINNFDALGLWNEASLMKFLNKTEGGRELLQQLRDKQAAGWQIMTFEKMEQDVYYGDGSKRKATVDALGYTDKDKKIIYIKDDGRWPSDAAKSLKHEKGHSDRKKAKDKEEYLAEENQVIYETEQAADSIGYSRDPNYYRDLNNDDTPDFELIGERIGRKPAQPKPGQPPASAETTAYTDQLEKKPTPPSDPKEAKRLKNKKVGTANARPINVKPLKLEDPLKKKP